MAAPLISLPLSCDHKVHNDDCLCYYDSPRSKMGVLVTAGLPEARDKNLALHASVKTDGILPTAAAPKAFGKWLRRVVDEWPFENLATAHNGTLIGGANSRVRQLLADSEALLRGLSTRNAEFELRTAHAASLARRADELDSWFDEALSGGQRSRKESGAWVIETDDDDCECG